MIPSSPPVSTTHVFRDIATAVGVANALATFFLRHHHRFDAIIGDSLYITIDEKPKRTDIPLKRLRNIMENPEIAVMVDHWDEDWRRLAWVMLRGRAEILSDGEEHDNAQARLRERYPQYRTMDLAPLPVIALRIARALAWGDLDGGAKA